jgi:YHS domain-containing protein
MRAHRWSAVNCSAASIGDQGAEMKVTDPVCGARIRIEEAGAQEDYEGWLYFFCSTDCRRRFRADPEQYIERVRPTGEPPQRSAKVEESSEE